MGPALTTAVAAKRINSIGEQAGYNSTADPTGGLVGRLAAEAPQAGGGVSTASGELLLRLVGEFTRALGQGFLFGVRQEASDVIPQSGYIIANAIEKSGRAAIAE